MIKRYAIIENNVVTNVAVAQSPLGENWVESDDASIGDVFENGVISKPTQPEE